MAMSCFQDLYATLLQVSLSQGVAQKQLLVGDGGRAKTWGLVSTCVPAQPLAMWDRSRLGGAAIENSRKLGGLKQ